MSDLVRVRVGDVEYNVGRTDAARRGLEVLDEPTHTPAGNLRPETRVGGRPKKQKTTVADSAAAKAASPAGNTSTPPSTEEN